ncbi:Cobalt-precorrin-6x reductase [Klebsiella michiganensis]|nr:Cobalt-precorrin-6x reductase [Klebsiella michiganensis]
MLSVIGIGPGSQSMMTMEAIEALQAAEIVVGYKTYTHLVKAFTGDKQVIKTGMCKEIERCQAAIELAQAGHNVALISSGDAGIYGMAGLVLELVSKQKLDVEVRLIPGMTASIAAASLLGAPLMHDFCHISLSDLLTPWPVIEKRIVAAGEADFVICFYNPRSRGREGHLARAFELLSASKSAQTPVGVVKSAGRKKQEKWLTTLGEMDFAPVDMTSLVIVGNKATYIQDGLMITPTRLRAVSHGEVLVMGGTSDARALCQQLDAAQVKYTLSVATPTGQQLAGDIRGQVRCGRLELEEMIAWLKANRTRWVIDASHPYAEAVSRNIVRACETAGVLLSRYQRPEQLSGLTHPLLYTVESIEQACEVARRFGQRVLLTTGSKDLARWRAGLGEKTLLARVLPVADVIAQCAGLGFGVGEIFALCGPFSAEFNAAFYRQCRADVVITKASGAEGGYQEKVQPCLDAGIPCIVITRPAPLVTGEELLESQAAFARRLARWLAAA